MARPRPAGGVRPGLDAGHGGVATENKTTHGGPFADFLSRPMSAHGRTRPARPPGAPAAPHLAPCEDSCPLPARPFRGVPEQTDKRSVSPWAPRSLARPRATPHLRNSTCHLHGRWSCRIRPAATR